MIDNYNNLYIGSDHAGYLYKIQIIKVLEDTGYEVTDLGTFSEEKVDYPDYAHLVAESVEKNNYSKGILICGSGNGVCMTANKHKNIRAALCWTTEIAYLARMHNDANIVCIPARFINIELAVAIIKIFLTTKFEGGRHERRVKKIPL
jgi:ribose 5-phosphate isomerase B